ncbi:MAG: hypothetical protein ACPGJS_06755 [Flammeovirgaceae bacterium]
MTESLSSPKKLASPLTTLQNRFQNRLWSFIAFLLFMSFIAALYLLNRGSWKEQAASQQLLIDSLQNHTQELSHRIAYLQKAKQQEIESIRTLSFDSFDEDQYRVYGLYRDKNKKQTLETISQKFNVYNAGAIKYSDVLGERWFIVPIKGVHFMREDETLEEISMQYYGNPADSMLIVQFNPVIKPLKSLFIPFSD